MDDELKQLEQIYQILTDFFVNYSFQLLGALIIIVLGIWIGHKVSGLVLHLCEKKSLDVTLSHFLASTAKLLVIFMMIIIALGKIGISIGPFIAALGAVSLGAGLALQSPLSNYGAGLNLIMTRPFLVGDTIMVQGVAGVVREIKLGYTVLSNEDGVKITIPNRHIIGEVIHNSQGNTLIELEVGISYHSDPEQAITVVRQALGQLEPDSTVSTAHIGIDAFGDSNILLGIRLWAETEKHFQIRYQANGLIYQSLKAAGIEIAYPQREVKMLN